MISERKTKLRGPPQIESHRVLWCNIPEDVHAPTIAQCLQPEFQTVQLGAEGREAGLEVRAICWAWTLIILIIYVFSIVGVRSIGRSSRLPN